MSYIWSDYIRIYQNYLCYIWMEKRKTKIENRDKVNKKYKWFILQLFLLLKFQNYLFFFFSSYLPYVITQNPKKKKIDPTSSDGTRMNKESEKFVLFWLEFFNHYYWSTYVGTFSGSLTKLLKLKDRFF